MALILTDEEIKEAQDRMLEYLLEYMQNSFEVDDLMDLFEVLGISTNRDYIKVAVSDAIVDRRQLYLNRHPKTGRLRETEDGCIEFVIVRQSSEEIFKFKIEDIHRIEFVTDIYIMLKHGVRTEKRLSDGVYI